jgi:AraC-like DNA-binding protein
LNKRAASLALPARSLWHIADERSVFAGPLRYNAPHSHSVAVLIAGLYGAFRIRIARENWRTVKAAVVAAGTAYELDVGGEAVCVIYLEPGAGGGGALSPLLAGAEGSSRAQFGSLPARGLMRELYEDEASGAWAGEALDDVTREGRSGGRRDPRIARVLKSLRTEPQPLGETLARAGVALSPSRFQHLFAAEVGVPFRRYRSWCRLRTAVREVIGGGNLTDAAHAAGFADSAHFSRVFRQTFGAPPSASLTHVRG